MAVLDTSVLLDLSGRGGRRRERLARERVRELDVSGHTLVTTRFNAAELWVGVDRSRDRRSEAGRVERLLGPLPVLEFDAGSARLFGRVTAHLLDRGRPVGDMDVLIAAVTLEHGHALLTANPSHFREIPGLEVLTY